MGAMKQAFKKAVTESGKVWADLRFGISNAPWNGSPSAYPNANAYCAACLVDTNASGATKVEGNCHLPVRDSAGNVNRNGVHAAAGRLGQTSLSPADMASAKAKLRGLYTQLGEPAPDSLK